MQALNCNSKRGNPNIALMLSIQVFVPENATCELLEKKDILSGAMFINTPQLDLQPATNRSRKYFFFSSTPCN